LRSADLSFKVFFCVKILVIGNGGREHAIAWKLLQSSQVTQVLCVPGNAGTASLERCKNLSFQVDDFAGIIRFVETNGVRLVVVGPELPLAKGIVDLLQEKRIPVFGPPQAGARIESSKSWAKEMMLKAGVPTAKSETFDNPEAAKAYVLAQGAPIVVKADGLAGGKGVIVAQTNAEAELAIDQLFSQGFDLVVVEEFLIGEELSVLAITDGITIAPLLPAQDHKRIGDGDTGANTGGMGAYAPAPIATPALMQRVQKEVLEPMLQAFQQEGIDYRGILYAGLMISPTGDLQVLEFNCRFGDPETQAILPLLETPLVELLMACVEQRLASVLPISWYPAVSTCVVVAAGGYPGSYQKGQPISSVAPPVNNSIIFQAGTAIKQGQLVTDGGRVLSVTAFGNDFQQSIDIAYQAVKTVYFADMYYRQDIGQRALVTNDE
jgi:phosphoribosylamine--glycine ligase